MKPKKFFQISKKEKIMIINCNYKYLNSMKNKKNKINKDID